MTFIVKLLFLLSALSLVADAYWLMAAGRQLSSLISMDDIKSLQRTSLPLSVWTR